MKRPTEADFEIKVLDSGVEAIFNPTKSHYTFHRLADPQDIAKHGPLSPDVRVRHAGKTGDTDQYPSHEVQAMAYRLATAAIRKANR
jgi:hypothetical protein